MGFIGQAWSMELGRTSLVLILLLFDARMELVVVNYSLSLTRVIFICRPCTDTEIRTFIRLVSKRITITLSSFLYPFKLLRSRPTFTRKVSVAYFGKFYQA